MTTPQPDGHRGFCVNCKHYNPYNEFVVNYCASPRLPVSLVTGTIIIESCDVLRADEDRCGPIGKWFEAKK